MSSASQLFFNVKPPSNVTDSPYQVQSATTGAAAGTAVFTSMAAAAQPKGKVWVTFEARTTDAYVRFGPATSAATTANTGMIIKADQPGRVFYLDPTEHAFVDHVAPAGAGKLVWQVSSPMGERNRV